MSENARKLDALITETRFDELKTKLAAAEALVRELEANDKISHRTIQKLETYNTTLRTELGKIASAYCHSDCHVLARMALEAERKQVTEKVTKEKE